MNLSPSRLGVLLLRTRRTARAPLVLYRRGLGWLLGSRMMMLEHRGRRSGLPRQVVLEVIARPEPGTLLVASGFGRSSQWYRNLEATPACRVSTGRIRRRPAEADLLDRVDSAAAIDDYRRDHPASWEFLRGVIEADGAQDPAEIPVVAFRLADDGAR